MNEREYLFSLLQRVKRLCDRNTVAICTSLQSRQKLHELDSLFTRGEKASALFRRVYARYEATLSREDLVKE